MKKLRRTLVPALLCTLLLHPLSFAHGGMEHFLGTVPAISDHFLSLNTSDGAVIRIEFDLETKFTKGGAPATVKDVQVESRVVIHAHKRDNSLHAAEVRIGTGRAHGQH